MKRSGAARPWMESSRGIGRSTAAAEPAVKANPSSDLSSEAKAKHSSAVAEQVAGPVSVPVLTPKNPRGVLDPGLDSGSWQTPARGTETPEMKIPKDSQVRNPIEAEFPNLPLIAKVVSRFGELYNGFEAEGAENIPKEGPALIVFYHGLVPLDAWYFGLQYYIQTGRLIRGLGDRWLFKTPLIRDLVTAVGAKEGRPETALALLKKGELVGVSPGGVREAIAGASNHYKLLWGNRQGFARVAIEARVPVIPAFTVNVEETYRAPFADHPFFQKLYESTRLPLVPVVGLGVLPFPVGLKTVIGEPIPFDPEQNPKELAEKTRQSLERLIAIHQPKATSVLKAMLNRFLSPRG